MARYTIFFKTPFLALLLMLSACASQRVTVPPGVIPEAHEVLSEDEKYGHEVFSELAGRFPLDQNDSHINRVRDIVNRLTKAARADRNPWHVYVLVDDNFKNAAATRGNFVFVWTGMLNTVENDGELATVLAHEIGHVLAGHTNPDPSEEVNEMLAGVAGRAAHDIVAAQGQIGIVASLAEAAISESIKAFIVNPEAQRKELEADQIGLFLMAKAGFDPEEGVRFWERMGADSSFSGLPLQFMSTHPSSKDRLKRLKELLPDAMNEYQNHSNFSQIRRRNNKQPNGVSSTWIVSAKWADIFEAPSTRSHIVLSLPQNTSIEAQPQERGWLKVFRPLKGYVRASQLSR